MIIGLGLAILMGMALGLLGGGGSILAVPILLYAFGLEAKMAIALSLGVVGLTSIAGTALNWKNRNIDWQAVFYFAPAAMAGTYGGARIAAYIPGAIQLAFFAVIMFVTAFFMFRKTKEGAKADFNPSWKRQLLIIAEGLGVGIVTGIVGVGGGFLIVPALVLLGGLSMRKAIGTSLVIIALKSAAGFWGYAQTLEIPWGVFWQFSAASIVGIVIGSQLVHRLPTNALRTGFASFLLIMSFFMLYKNLPSLLS